MQSLRDPKHQKILEASKSLWIDYEPRPCMCVSVGIDSSWNSKSFQGLDLYVVDAVVVDSHNVIRDKRYAYNMTTIKDVTLQSTALAMEIELLEQLMHQDQTYIVCIDGSVESKIIGASGELRNKLVRLLSSSPKLAFVSKNSDSKSYFDSEGATLGDIYYFNHIGRSAGYSSPFLNKKYAKDFGYFVEIFARLRHSTPIIKIEFALDRSTAEKIDDEVIRNLLDELAFHSIAGYPQCLAYAHDSCVVSHQDLNEIASIYSLKDEIGSRALLER